MTGFVLHGPSEEYGGVHMEFHAGLSWREIWIEKLENGQYSMDILVFGEFNEDIRFDTLDELMEHIVDTWNMDESKVKEVKAECEKITIILPVDEKPVM